MIKELTIFVTSFALCATIAWTGSGCSDEALCPATPDRPSAQPTRPATLRVRSGEDPRFQPQDVSLAVSPDRVVIRYTASEATHEVVYAVDGR